MLFYAYKILIHEGILINVFLFFLLFSPIYLLDMFLVIPLALLLLHREILNLSAPSERFVVLYQLFGLPVEFPFRFNILLILTVNVVNMLLLICLTLFAGESIPVSDYLKQVLVLNGVLFFAVAFGNAVLYCRLIRSTYYTVHKLLIVPLFVFFVLLLFTILFFLSQDQPVVAGVICLLILVAWIISILKQYG